MTKTEQRAAAIGAVRAEARRLGREPLKLSVDAAMAMLDDLARREPELVASNWWVANAETNARQVHLFCKEWSAWKEAERTRQGIEPGWGY